MCASAWSADRPAFQTLRYNEDWSALQDCAQRADFFDSAKYIPLSTNADWYLSFGGEARLKYELYTEAVLNQKPADDDGFLLQRYLLSRKRRKRTHQETTSRTWLSQKLARLMPSNAA